MGSDKATGADNQQERPVAAQWVVGFVDGEGCFSVPIFKNGTCRSGWQVQPEFTVVQGVRSVQVLDLLKDFFGCGYVGVNRRRDNHREDLARYRVTRLGDLSRFIVPFFEANPLRTAKRESFTAFAVIIRMMMEKGHLTEDGLRQIATIASAMNFRRRSQLLESSEAIRQPSCLDGQDEDMVLAAWRHAGS